MYKDSWRVKFDEEKREEGYIFVDTKYFVFLPSRNTFFEGKWEGMELGSGWILYRRKMGEEILYVPL